MIRPQQGRPRALPRADRARPPKEGGGVPPDHLRQRRTIQRVAEDLFAARGYRGTSIRMVAARSRCSVGQLYNLYGSKLELYRFILEGKIQELGGRMEGALAKEAPVEEKLRELLTRVLGFFQENSAFFRIYAVETGSRLWHSQRSPIEGIVRRHGEWLDWIVSLIREGQDSGYFRADADPRSTAISLSGMIKGHATEWVLGGRGEALVDRVDGILELSVRGLRSRGGSS